MGYRYVHAFKSWADSQICCKIKSRRQHFTHPSPFSGSYNISTSSLGDAEDTLLSFFSLLIPQGKVSVLSAHSIAPQCRTIRHDRESSQNRNSVYYYECQPM